MNARRIAGLVLVVSACADPPSPASPGDGSTGGSSGATATITASESPEGSSSGAEDTGVHEPACGDGLVDVPEECDLGDDNGTGRYCKADCKANRCGDGYLGPGEQCDDGLLASGERCNAECEPAACGDGHLQANEECDDGRDNATDGACLPSCVAAKCGDLRIQALFEACDGPALGEASCEVLGYDGGVLQCDDDCWSFDTSECYVCGNDVLEAPEECDGFVPDGLTCDDFAPPGSTALDGTLYCSGCSIVIDCVYCGDGIWAPPEQCDGVIPGATCETLGLGFGGGELSCTGCMYDVSDCCYAEGMSCGSDDDCCSGQCVTSSCAP